MFFRHDFLVPQIYEKLYQLLSRHSLLNWPLLFKFQLDIARRGFLNIKFSKILVEPRSQEKNDQKIFDLKERKS